MPSTNNEDARQVLEQRGCEGCRTVLREPFRISFAFQPIVDVSSSSIFACEALVRGTEGESAASVLSKVDEGNRYHFDQLCRTTAIEHASRLAMDTFLSINFMPNAVYRPEACIRSTFAAAEKYKFPIERVIFETVEGENIISRPHLVNIFKAYKEFGFQTAIDDFGAGYSGLTLLADFQPDFIKLDMELVRNIDKDQARQAIVRGVLSMCDALGVRVIAEGIETRGERDFFLAHGVTLMQGYFFAKPALGQIPQPNPQAFD